MKWEIFAIIGICGTAFLSGCDRSETSSQVLEITAPVEVDAGCGRCMFGRKEDKGCNLAIRVGRQSYFVDGFTIKQFGNPDLQGGMCKRIHPAKVAGKVVNGRFAASTFELISKPAPGT